jgi:hypothetical protein
MKNYVFLVCGSHWLENFHPLMKACGAIFHDDITTQPERYQTPRPHISLTPDNFVVTDAIHKSEKLTSGSGAITVTLCTFPNLSLLIRLCLM